MAEAIKSSARSPTPQDQERAPQNGVSAQGREVGRAVVGIDVDVLHIDHRKLVFQDRESAAELRRPALNAVAGPFCELAKAVNQPAAVVVSLHSEQVMQVADCADGRFSSWESADPASRQLTAAAQACQAIENSPYPVSCVMGTVEDRPSLVVRYASGGVSESDMAYIGARVARPFCDAIGASGVEAFVYLVEDDRRARGLNCLTGVDSGWVRIERQRPRTPNPPQRRGPSRPSGSEHRQVQAFAEPYRYRLLPVASNAP